MWGGGVNPAVATALRVANLLIASKYNIPEQEQAEWTFFIVYWVGPMIGGLMGAFCHYIFEASTTVYVRNEAQKAEV